MKRIKVPQYLHRPYQVLFFEVDELVVFILLLVLSLFFGGLFWFLLIPLPFFMNYLKKRFPRGYLKHFLYVSGIILFRGAPSGFENKFEE